MRESGIPARWDICRQFSQIANNLYKFAVIFTYLQANFLKNVDIHIVFALFIGNISTFFQKLAFFTLALLLSVQYITNLRGKMKICRQKCAKYLSIPALSLFSARLLTTGIYWVLIYWYLLDGPTIQTMESKVILQGLLLTNILYYR